MRAWTDINDKDILKFAVSSYVMQSEPLLWLKFSKIFLFNVLTCEYIARKVSIKVETPFWMYWKRRQWSSTRFNSILPDMNTKRFMSCSVPLNFCYAKQHLSIKRIKTEESYKKKFFIVNPIVKNIRAHTEFRKKC